MKDEKGATSNQPLPGMQRSLVASRFFTYLVLGAICAGLLVYATRGKERYFVNAPNGTMTEVFPLNEPNVTDTSLLKWVTQAASSVYTLDFYHYQDNLDSAREYFTIAGYKDFLKSIQNSGSLKQIISEKLIVSAVATDTAVILQEGPLSGVYTWRIQIPLLLTYQGASSTSTQKSIAVSLLVTRVPTDIAPKGIGIAQIVDTEIHGE